MWVSTCEADGVTSSACADRSTSSDGDAHEPCVLLLRVDTDRVVAWASLQRRTGLHVGAACLGTGTWPPPARRPGCAPLPTLGLTTGPR
jgi:hypothetical protein